MPSERELQRRLNEEVLERGSPDEILPADRYKWKGLAHRYVRGADAPPAAKDRVEAVWIKGEERPPWSEVRKLPDYRGKFHGTPTEETELG